MTTRDESARETGISGQSQTRQHQQGDTRQARQVDPGTGRGAQQGGSAGLRGAAAQPGGFDTGMDVIFVRRQQG